MAEDEPEGGLLTGNLAADELILRQAIAAKALAVLSAPPFDFPEANVHDRNRYIRDDTKWELLTTIVDPDDASQRTMRLFSVETASSDATKYGWAVQWAAKVGVGFNDERPENRGNTHDYLMRAAYTLMQQFLEDSTLGVSTHVEVTRVRHAATRFVPSDKQGKPAQVADLLVYATVELC